jgi:hypothetical protein
MEDAMPDTPRDDLLEVLEAISKAQLRTIRRLQRSPKTKSRTPATAVERRLSGMDMIVDILQRERRPLHITDLLAAVQKQFDIQLDRESVVSAISKRVARRDRFMRTAPNTFALIPEREDS